MQTLVAWSPPLNHFLPFVAMLPHCYFILFYCAFFQAHSYYFHAVFRQGCPAGGGHTSHECFLALGFEVQPVDLCSPRSVRKLQGLLPAHLTYAHHTSSLPAVTILPLSQLLHVYTPTYMYYN